MLAKGININDESSRKTIIKQGNNIRSYFEKKHQQSVEQKEKLLCIKSKIGNGVSRLMQKNSKRHYKKTIMSGDDDNEYIPFKLVTNEVEELLTKKPLKLKGIGLPDNFNQLFGPAEGTTSPKIPNRVQ